MKTFLLTLFFVIIGVVDFAQNTKKTQLVITGRVVSCDSQPVNAASIIIKGSRYGAITTNRDGYFELTRVVDGDSIIFTHVAYKKIVVKVNGNNLINVIMDRAVNALTTYNVIDSVKKKNHANSTVKSDDYIFDKVEIFPSFPGGREALFVYLSKTVKYPDGAKKKNIEGEVVVGFTVGLSGEIKNVQIVRGISKECDEVALKAIREMPHWINAIQNGHSTEAYMELPIIFSLIEKR